MKNFSEQLKQELKQEIQELQQQLEEAEGALEQLEKGETEATSTSLPGDGPPSTEHLEQLLIAERTARHEALAARDRITHILDRITDAFMAIDTEWRFTYVNPKACEIFHKRSEELIGKKIGDEFGSAIAEPFYRTYSEAIAEQVSKYVEAYYPPFDCWYESYVYPAEDGLSIWLRDTSDRNRSRIELQKAKDELEIHVADRAAELKQANDRLQWELKQRQQMEAMVQRAYQRLQFHVENTPMAAIEWNRELRVVKWSKRAEKILGWPAEEVLGNTLVDWQFIHEADVEPFTQVMERLTCGQEPRNISYHRNYTKDGKTIDCEWYNSVLLDRNGQPISILSLVLDISDRKQAQAALRSSQARLAAILQLAGDAIISLNENQQITLYNQAAEKVFGYPAKEVLGQPLDLLLPSRFAASHRQQVRGFGRSPDPARTIGQRGEIVGRRQDGTEFSAEASISQIEVGGEKVYTVCLRDISDRKRSEAERAKLIQILEATPDFISSSSIEGKVFYFNKAARNILGLPLDDPLENFYISQGHPEWVNQIICNEGIPTAIAVGTWIGETALLSHDGREIPLSQVITAHKGADGTVNMLSTIARDISQQKEIEATVREAERRWRSLLENVRLVVVGLDRTGKIEYANPFFLELVGYTLAEVLEQNWFEMFLPAHQKARLQNTFLDMRPPDFYTHLQNVIITKSGEEKVIAWNNTVLKNVQGDDIGTLSIGEDITELEAIERMKDEFISVVSHELRTPLTSIHGSLNLLASGLVDPRSQKGQRVLQIAAESCDRLVRLVNDILELDRLESGKIPLVKKPCNIVELIERAVDLMQVMANRAGVHLAVEALPIELEIDGDRIIQVITHLVSNAIQFSPPNATVWLTAEPGNSSLSCEEARIGDRQTTSDASEFGIIVFKVKDEGRGIPPDKIESIFERFHQVDASDSRQKGGTGLGLAICRSIVQQHGGRIWVESILDKGSTFYFTLPVSIQKGCES